MKTFRVRYGFGWLEEGKRAFFLFKGIIIIMVMDMEIGSTIIGESPVGTPI